jgi:CRP/FNR family transcriptional regulator, cyclic AMP receptor protein
MDEQKIKNVPLFSDLDKAQLKRIAQISDEVDVREGTELLHEGSFAHEFMVIEKVRADVIRQGEKVAELAPGDFLGEIAALDRGQRNATVVATTPMTLIVMTDRDLRHIASEMPALSRILEAVAKARTPLHG